jgi:CheY-like chemotaxis protein
MQPLALVLYQNLFPGSKLVTRLQDLNYRVQAFSDAESLIKCAHSEGPMLILIDLDSPQGDIANLVSRLRQGTETGHLPIVAFSASEEKLPVAQTAGATLAVGETALLTHLSEVLEQALRVE